MACEICGSGTPHFDCCYWLAVRGFRLFQLSATKGILPNVNATAINALKADIQAMNEGEARTTATKELEAAQQMMANNDLDGCKSHIHSAMEATEK